MKNIEVTFRSTDSHKYFTYTISKNGYIFYFGFHAEEYSEVMRKLNRLKSGSKQEQILTITFKASKGLFSDGDSVRTTRAEFTKLIDDMLKAKEQNKVQEIRYFNIMYSEDPVKTVRIHGDKKGLIKLANWNLKGEFKWGNIIVYHDEDGYHVDQVLTKKEMRAMQKAIKDMFEI